MNLMSMMKQAQNLQKRIQEVQKELDEKEIVKEYQNGAVKVTCNGQGSFKSIKLSAAVINPENPEAVDQDTIETLEDIINNAICETCNVAKKDMEKKMKGLIPGGLNIPGLM
ncbi:YbaB/EbfC family nucleoid-associated protein [bacterium]|nr:YbaB/EbfC family nucleoid-associated protein [bacterium]